MRNKIQSAMILALFLMVTTPCFSAMFPWMKSNLQKKITNLRIQAEQMADENMVKKINFLSQNHLIDNPIASSKVDVCYVAEEDAGWFPANWHQDCYIRYVEGFNTSLNKNKLAEILKSNHESSNYFGDVYDDHCNLYEQELEPSLIFLPVGKRDNIFCKVPGQLQGIFSVHGPITSDDKLVTRPYRRFQPQGIDITKKQVWLTLDKHYYHESLGCIKLVFCFNPRKTPIIGK